MCGRYTLRTPPSVLVEHFRLGFIPEMSPRYNVAPTQQIGIVRRADGDQREFAWAQWGLVPRWAKDPKIGNSMINARAETAAEKPAFRDAYRKRRCLIAADGFYEWKKTGAKTKQPYYMRLKDDRPFGIAGLWERCGELESCTILTTSPNELCANVHDRMPVILSPNDYDQWLDPALTDPADLQPLLDAYPADEMLATPVSTHVNNVRNIDKACIAPAAQQQQLL
jgi:putative SOS response-associated peptidase YedK